MYRHSLAKTKSNDVSGEFPRDGKSLLGSTLGDALSVVITEVEDGYQVVMEYTRESFLRRIGADNVTLRSLPHWEVKSATVDTATYMVTFRYTQPQASRPVVGRKPLNPKEI